MANINWSVYLLIGLFVSLISLKIDYERLMVFFYAGLVFIFVGFAKLVYDFLKNRKNKQSPQTKVNKHIPHSQEHIKYCTNCGSSAVLHHKFCSKCGARI